MRLAPVSFHQRAGRSLETPYLLLTDPVVTISDNPALLASPVTGLPTCLPKTASPLPVVHPGWRGPGISPQVGASHLFQLRPKESGVVTRQTTSGTSTVVWCERAGVEMDEELLSLWGTCEENVGPSERWAGPSPNLRTSG